MALWQIMLITLALSLVSISKATQARDPNSASRAHTGIQGCHPNVTDEECSCCDRFLTPVGLSDPPPVSVLSAPSGSSGPVGPATSGSGNL